MFNIFGGKVIFSADFTDLCLIFLLDHKANIFNFIYSVSEINSHFFTSVSFGIFFMNISEYLLTLISKV